MGHHGGEVLFDKRDESGAAGACEEALFDQLARFSLGYHVGAESRLYDCMEAERLDSAYHLTELCVGELAGDGGRNDRIDLVLFVVVALLDEVDHVEDERLIHYRAEGALIYARAAGDALFVVDGCGFVLAHGDRLYLAGVLAGALTADYSGVGADLGARSAADAEGFVDVRHMLVVKGYRVATADVLAAVSQTAAAGVCDLVAAHGAFVTGDLYDLYDVGIFLVSAHGELYALGEDRALLVNAAAHRGGGAGNDLRRYVKDRLKKRVVPRLTRDLAQDLVFEMLNFGIEFSHFELSLKINYLYPFAHLPEAF